MKKIVLLCLLLIVSLFTACSPYTTQGNIIGKHITQDNRYAIQIQFVDNNGNIKNFDWYVTAETYEVYKVGDITDVNVRDTLSGTLFMLLAGVIAAIFIAVIQYTKKRKDKKEIMSVKTFEEEIAELEWDDKNRISELKRKYGMDGANEEINGKKKTKMTIFGIKIK